MQAVNARDVIARGSSITSFLEDKVGPSSQPTGPTVSLFYPFTPYSDHKAVISDPAEQVNIDIV